MLRNGQELTKCRQQLIMWYSLRSEVARMVKKGGLENASDLVDVIEQRVQHLKAEIDAYESPLRSAGQDSPFDVLRHFPRLPEALINARITLGLSQRQFARIAKMSAQQLSRYERTQFANLTLKNAAKLIGCLESQLTRPPSNKTDGASDNIELGTIEL